MVTQQELDNEVQQAQAAYEAAFVVLQESRQLLHRAQDANSQAESRHEIARRIRDRAIIEAKMGYRPEDPASNGPPSADSVSQ